MDFKTIRHKFFILSLWLVGVAGLVQTPVYAINHPHFRVLPLGTSGGELENNLSAYLVSVPPSNSWIALDAGTLCSAIKNISPAEFSELGIVAQRHKTAGQILLQRIQAYLISHAHLDHISGLTICSTLMADGQIFGRETTLAYLRDYIFNWKIWPNFADQGQPPLLKTLHYHALPLQLPIHLAKTDFVVTAFALDHGDGYPSTAFLLNHQFHYLLYLGDTGPDPVQHSQAIAAIWHSIVPLIRARQLSAIFIEASYPNGRADNLLFGHLTPRWVLLELHQLARRVNPQQPELALKGLVVVITHVKQGLEKSSTAQIIMQQLRQANDLGVKFILPVAGHRLEI